MAQCETWISFQPVVGGIDNSIEFVHSDWTQKEYNTILCEARFAEDAELNSERTEWTPTRRFYIQLKDLIELTYIIY